MQGMFFHLQKNSYLVIYLVRMWWLLSVCFCQTSSFWSPKSDMFDPQVTLQRILSGNTSSVVSVMFSADSLGATTRQECWNGWSIETFWVVDRNHGEWWRSTWSRWFWWWCWKSIFCESLQALCHVQLQRLSDVALEHQGPHVFCFFFFGALSLLHVSR